jgi:hypothetical protein
LGYFFFSSSSILRGRFITPFGIYGERLAPNWIRALQLTPLILPVTSGSSLGGMLRGGFPVGEKVNFNYAAYFSASNTNHIVATDRSTGARYVLVVKNDVYRLDDQNYAERFAGAKVRITGTLDAKTHVLHILTIEEAK